MIWGSTSSIILNRKYVLCVTQTKTSSLSELLLWVPWPHHHLSVFWWTHYDGKFLDNLILVLLNWQRHFMSLSQCQCYPDESCYWVNTFLADFVDIKIGKYSWWNIFHRLYIMVFLVTIVRQITVKPLTWSIPVTLTLRE